MRIAEQQGLLSAAPAAAAGGWRQDGDLPWALASQLAPLALQSGALGGEQAGRVALGACAAIEQSLRPVLQQDDASSEASAHGSPMHSQLPTPAFVAAAAALAAQTAGSLAERQERRGGGAAPGADGTAAADAVLDTLLTVCEDCTAAVAEIGVGDRASDALLNICTAVARELLPLLAGAGGRDPNALQDQLPRLQAVLVRGGGVGGVQRARGRAAAMQPACPPACLLAWQAAVPTCPFSQPHHNLTLRASRAAPPAWPSWSTCCPATRPRRAPARWAARAPPPMTRRPRWRRCGCGTWARTSARRPRAARAGAWRRAGTGGAWAGWLHG